jgi:serine protease Do
MKNTLYIAVWGILALPFGALSQAPPPPPPATPARVFTVPPGGSYLGIGIQEMTAERAKALKLPEVAGVEITRVGPDSPADKAGLKSGDVVLQYNGVKVEGIEQFSRLVRETPVGREEKLDIFRNGAPQTVTVKIGQHPALPGFPDGFGFRLPDVPRVFPGMRSPMLGVEAESIDGQLAQYFGVNEGVLVRSVMKNSVAEKAGIKAGDVILRLDDMKVASPADISARLRSARGKVVMVTLMREHKETALPVDVPEPRFGRAEPVRLITFE